MYPERKFQMTAVRIDALGRIRTQDGRFRGMLPNYKQQERLGGLTMMIARWTCEAKFGMKSEALALNKQWAEQIGSQTDIDISGSRVLTGSVGAKEAVIQNEFEVANLAELDAFFEKIASIKMHAEWGKKMGEVIVSGSTYWEVFRVVE